MCLLFLHAEFQQLPCYSVLYKTKRLEIGEMTNFYLSNDLNLTKDSMWDFFVCFFPRNVVILFILCSICHILYFS